ncbi:MAG: ABC transporter ATP-binding protein [Coriobacteriales bacterium]|jgi:spermidine/putrescine transport system ATP-binding protein|nr:ABC transporter ATP-binding protein [Coriobacteriales bacterium]
MASQAIVELKNVDKRYGENHVVKDLNLAINEGEFLSILGPSGCGKTTTLRMIAGFEQQSSGTILVEGEPVEDKEPFERNVNTVFQSYALFPHMTVFENVAFGLKMKRTARAEIRERVQEALALVQLEGFEKRYPSQLSGGQKQRVAIARAIINQPKVLLLDEPLGALDLKLRKQMQLELKRLQKRLGITFVYVTHDQEEALTMSDRIAVMHEGILDQLDAPSRIYDFPATRFVADFIGESNIFDGLASPQGKNIVVTTEAGRVLGQNSGGFEEGEQVQVSVRPEKLRFDSEAREGFDLEGTVRENIFVGTFIKSILLLSSGQEVVLTSLSGQAVPEEGRSYHLFWEPSDAVILHSRSQEIWSTIANVDLSGFSAEADASADAGSAETGGANAAPASAGAASASAASASATPAAASAPAAAHRQKARA